MNRAIKIQSILIQVDFWTSLLKGMVLKKRKHTSWLPGGSPLPTKTYTTLVVVMQNNIRRKFSISQNDWPWKRDTQRNACKTDTKISV